MKRFTKQAREAASVLLKSKRYTEEDVASLLSVPLRSVKLLSQNPNDGVKNKCQ